MGVLPGRQAGRVAEAVKASAGLRRIREEELEMFFFLDFFDTRRNFPELE